MSLRNIAREKFFVNPVTSDIQAASDGFHGNLPLRLKHLFQIRILFDPLFCDVKELFAVVKWNPLA